MPKGYTSQKGVIYSDVIRDMAEDPNFLNEEVRGRLSRMRYREQEYLGGNVENIATGGSNQKRFVFDSSNGNVRWQEGQCHLAPWCYKPWTNSWEGFHWQQRYVQTGGK